MISKHKKNVKLFTHTDLDGVGCAVLAMFAFGKDNVDITYCDYNDVNENIGKYVDNKEFEKFNSTFITDISVNDEVAIKIDLHNAEVTNKQDYRCNYIMLMDHHPTALDLNRYGWCNVKVESLVTKMKTSGTELFYEYLICAGSINLGNKSINRFIEIVRDYDTWRWNAIGEQGLISKQINDLLYIYGTDDFIEWCFYGIQNEVFPELGKDDISALNRRQKEIDDYVKEKDREMISYKINEKCFGVVFADKYISELGNRLCELNQFIDFVALINIGNKTVSYRTIRHDIDLGKDIAVKFGGGGHKMAAGSPISDALISNIIKEVFAADMNGIDE